MGEGKGTRKPRPSALLVWSRVSLFGALVYTRFPAAHVRVGDTVVLRNPDESSQVVRDKVTKIRRCSAGHILWETENPDLPGHWHFLGCTRPEETVEVM